MKKYKVEYSSNNSGGSWWLKDKDWKSLEKAGWKINWFGEQDKESLISKLTIEEGRFLGALADRAEKSFEAKSPKEAIGLAVKDWEKITKQEATDEGCNCCGAPHSFSASGKDTNEKYYEYGSGEDLLNFMGFDASKSKRELLESLTPPLGENE